MRLVSLTTLGLVAALLTLSSVAASAGTTGSLTGVVRDAQTGAPIANALIRAFSGAQVESTRTDESGNFAFASLTPGDYDIAVRSEGYWSASERVVVHADASRNLALTLLPIAEAVITPGRDILVTSRAAGNLVKPGTIVELDDWTWPPWPEAPETSDISVYRAYTYDSYVLPWSNSFFIQMTPSITFGVGAPMMH